jgi:hypothetical protein
MSVTFTPVPKLKAQLPIKIGVAAVNTYGRIILFFCLIFVITPHLENSLNPLFIFGFIFLIKHLFSSPSSVYLASTYIEIDKNKVHLNEIRKITQTTHTLNIIEHSGKKYVLKSNYYEPDLFSRFVVFLKDKVSPLCLIKTEQSLIPKTFSELARLLIIFNTIALCSLFIFQQTHLYHRNNPHDVEQTYPNPIFTETQVSLIMIFFVISIPFLLFFYPQKVTSNSYYIKIGKRKIMWNEMIEVEQSWGSTTLRDRWGETYTFNHSNYEEDRLKSLLSRITESVKENRLS